MSDERWTDLETRATRQREAEQVRQRDLIIEECARVAEGHGPLGIAQSIAAAIRALKDKP